LESSSDIGEFESLTVQGKSDYELRFSGVGRLYAKYVSEEHARQVGLERFQVVLDRLKKATVAVVGIGGVGSWAAESLCRSGVGNIILIDLDDICISNTNRQLHAMTTTVGNLKIDVTKERISQINPSCNVTTIFDFVSYENAEDIANSMVKAKVDICLDAIDNTRDKVALIAACVDKNIPLVTVGGAAGKTDPTQIVCEDMARTQGDRLLFLCRKELRQFHEFKQSNLSHPRRPSRKWNIPAIYSIEKDLDIEGLPLDNRSSSSLRTCDSFLGTACHVTGTFGLVAAGKVVEMIATDTISILSAKNQLAKT